MYLKTGLGTFVITDREDGRLRHLAFASACGHSMVEITKSISADDNLVQSGPLLGHHVYESKSREGFNIIKDGYFMSANAVCDDLPCNRLTPGPSELFTLVEKAAEGVGDQANSAQDAGAGQRDAPAPKGFLEMMAGAFAARCNLTSGIVYEIGSDTRLQVARELIELGARAVIATNIYPGWFQALPPGVVALVADVKSADHMMGPGTVDCVVGINILEHIDGMTAALASIRTILKPGGHFFLHGHPIWTCSTGHHAAWNQGDEHYDFGSASDPLPPFAHLYMDEQELFHHLLNKGVSAAAAKGLTDFALNGDAINRLPFRTMQAAFAESGLHIKGTQMDRGPAPDRDTLSRIKNARWWDDEEQYDVRQFTVWGCR